MGQQHNSHVANTTDDVIKVVLTDKDKRNSSQIITPGDHVCFPTPHGRVTVSVFRHLPGSTGQYTDYPEAEYTDDSDRSFMVKTVSGSLNIVRTKYGRIYQEDTGLRTGSFLSRKKKSEKQENPQPQPQPQPVAHCAYEYWSQQCK